VALKSLRVLDGGSLAFDSVWTSDLSRCRGLAETLEPALTCARKLRVDPRLRELDHGAFEGREWGEIFTSEPAVLERWGASWQTEGPAGGESAVTLEARTRDWLKELDATERHLLIGHAGVIRAVLKWHRGLEWPEAMALTVPHLTAIRIA
jgi:broad specificity phosphatase PhoE